MYLGLSGGVKLFFLGGSPPLPDPPFGNPVPPPPWPTGNHVSMLQSHDLFPYLGQLYMVSFHFQPSLNSDQPSLVRYSF